MTIKNGDRIHAGPKGPGVVTGVWRDGQAFMVTLERGGCWWELYGTRGTSAGAIPPALLADGWAYEGGAALAALLGASLEYGINLSPGEPSEGP